MNQKRFLTSDEVFQLFGVDGDALDALVASGDVKALPDRGSYKYRAEDFATLVQQGKLSPRTAGELFQVDSDGDIPFLKIKQDEPSAKHDENVSFIELDEDALEAQARQERPAQTPIVPEKWFDSDDSAELVSSKTPDEVAEPVDEDGTDFDFDMLGKTAAESDSNVQLVDDMQGSIDLDEPQEQPALGDSDVRLEGPVSSPISPSVRARRKPDSDSDVRLAKSAQTEAASDSDVTIPPSVSKPDSDSDVTLATPVSPSADPLGLESPTANQGSDSDVVLFPATAATSHVSDLGEFDAASDSDVVLMAPTTGPGSSAKIKTGTKPDSDSDVRIATSPRDQAEDHGGDSNIIMEAEHPTTAKQDSGIRFQSGDSGLALDDIDLNMLDDYVPGDSGIRLDATSASGINLDDSDLRLDTLKTDAEIPVLAERGPKLADFGDDSGLTLDTGEPDSGITLDSSKTDSEIAVQDESGISLETAAPDSGITLDTVESESGIALDSSRTDSEIAIIDGSDDSGLALDTEADDSGISLESDDVDSGITLESARTDSEIAIDQSGVDSGLALDDGKIDSGISLESDRTDSEIALAPDSGISLDDGALDSGLTLKPNAGSSGIGSGILSGDSGINLGFEFADSGISLEGDSSFKLGAGDSGIRLSETGESGLSLDDESEDGAATLAEFKTPGLSRGEGGDMTQTLDLSQELSDDLNATSVESLSDHTVEMSFDDSDDEVSETSATIVNKGRTKPLSLSEAFKLDEPLEVEDLDISEDLEDAVESEYSEEFAEADEEVLEASDDDFSAGEISVAEDGSEESLSEASAPVVKTRPLPKEPAWGLAAVIPIGASTLAMAATVVVLWGGMETMWTGGEAPGLASILISTLAGLLPL